MQSGSAHLGDVNAARLGEHHDRCSDAGSTADAPSARVAAAPALQLKAHRALLLLLLLLLPPSLLSCGARDWRQRRRAALQTCRLPSALAEHVEARSGRVRRGP
eukprot:148425-Chlamydomonas_euryale.AAC.5